MKQTEISKARGWWKHLLLLCVTLLGLVGFASASPNYPFPQNYQYPYGNIYTGTDVQSKIQSLYSTWKSKYYTESGNYARIKFVQDGESGTNTVSEGIAYGMLIMVYMDNATNNTQSCFDKLWNYYALNMNEHGVMNWKVNAFTGNVTSGDGNANGATDADLDVAQALLMAHKQWGSDGDINYLNKAQTLINNIWNYEVNSNKYLKPGDMFDDYKNPCYFITNAMTLFDNVKSLEGWSYSWDWPTVVSNCYSLMAKAANSTTGLIPDWCYEDGSYLSGLISSKFESIFGYDAVRIPWRLSQAYAWYGDTQAKTMAAKITSWAQTKYPNPANIVDGYYLNGNPGDGNTPFTGTLSSWGSSSNACFKAGLSIGSMVDDAYDNYMSLCWSNGSANDAYGAYYTHTTQLLFMLCLTGNMPNLYDMLPVATAAETNADGSSIYVDFSKPISSSSASSSKSYFTITTYADESLTNGTSISVSSASVSSSDSKRVILNLSSDISDPYIYITYNGTTLKGSDNSVASKFSDMKVTNLITSMEPYPTARYTDVYGTAVYIQWSKEISLTKASASDFTVYVNGAAVSTTPTLGWFTDADGTDKTVLALTWSETILSSASDVVTVTYNGGTITSTGGTKTSKAFTKSAVQNFYMNVSCLSLYKYGEASDRFSCNASNKPAEVTQSGSENEKTLYLSAGVWERLIYTPAAADKTEWTTDAATAGVRLKGRIYVSSCANDGLGVWFMAPALSGEPGYNADNAFIDLTSYSKTGWNEFDLVLSENAPLSWQSYSTAVAYTGLWIGTVDGTSEGGGKFEVYIDYLQLCPPDPVVEPTSGKVSYDGYQVELKFSTAMKVPTSTSAIVIKEGSVAHEVESIETKAGDASTLIFTLSEPISKATSTVKAILSAQTTDVKSADGRKSEVFNLTLANLYGMTTSTGWYDTFEDKSDYTTDNLAGDGDYVTVSGEDATNSLLKVNFSGDETWAGALTLTTTGAGYVMDLSNNSTIELKFKGSVAASTAYYRIDVVDFFGNESDGTWQSCSIGTSYQTITYNSVNWENADITSVAQVVIRFITDQGNAKNDYTPTIYDGTISLDYLSVGKALYLYDFTPSTVTNTKVGMDEDASFTVKSSTDGYIFVVKQDVNPQFSAMASAAVAGEGVQVSCTADVAATIDMTGLGYGYFLVYAYDPETGSVSSGVGVQVNDVTPPEFTDYYSLATIAQDGTLYFTVNEDATVYMVASTADISTVGKIAANSTYSWPVKGSEPFSVDMSTLTLTTGDVFKLVAVDGSGNISTAVPVKGIEIAQVALAFEVEGTSYMVGEDIKVTATRSTTAYLVSADLSVKYTTIAKKASVSQATNAYGVANIATDGLSITEATEYYIYVVDDDAEKLVGPSAKITIEPANYTLSSITLDYDALALTTCNSKDVTVSFVEAKYPNQDLTFSGADDYVDITYNSTNNSGGDGVITIAGKKGTSGKQVTLTITSAADKSVSTSIPITVQQLPTSVTITGESSMVPATTQTLKAVVEPEGVILETDAAITWKSSNTAVATVGSTGIVTSVSTGTTTITATTKKAGCDGTYVVGSFDLTVEAASLSSLLLYDDDIVEEDDAVSSLTIDIVKNGDDWGISDPDDYARIFITPDPAEAEIDVEATSSDESIATAEVSYKNNTWRVDVVYAGGKGTATITVTDKNSGVSSVITFISGEAACTTVAPTATEIPNVSVCEGNDANLTATFASSSAKAVWYSAAEAGTALYTGNTYATGKTAVGSYTYYVAKNDGCESETRTKVTLTITAKPSAAIASTVGDSYCATTESVTLAATPATGTWSGTGVTGTIFSPAIAGAGTHTVTYTVGETGCQNSYTKDITVTAAPSVTISVNESMCSNDAAQTLSATPATGTWSGTGVTGSSFDPAKGSSVVTYTYTDGPCEVVKTAEITVTNNPTPLISGLDESYCSDAAALTMTAAPTGGSFTVNGVAATTFNPATAKSGANTVEYTVSVNGCEGTASTSVTVNTVPTIDLSSVSTSVCANEEVSLAPTTGTWTGTGVTGTTFKSATAGSYELTYTESSNGCSASDAVTVTVNKATAPTASPATVELGGVVPALTASADGTINWYESETGASVATGVSYTPSISTATEKVYTYYVSNIVAGCESEKVAVTLTVTGCTVVAPTIAAVDAICEGDDFPTLTATATESTVTWYDAITDGNVLATSAAYIPSAAGTYYASQSSSECEGPRASVVVEVKAKPAAPTATGASSCAGAALVAMTTVETSNWYADKAAAAVATDAKSYTPASLATTTTYYVNQVVNGCTSDFAEVTYTVKATPAAPTVAASNACIGNTDDYVMKVTASETGASLQWYDAANSPMGTATTQAVSGVTTAKDYSYSVTQTVDGCTSEAATATLTVNALPTPSVTVGAEYCSNSDSEVSLTAEPAGGNFTIDGAAASAFTPSALSEATHEIVYTYTDANSCVGTASATFAVIDCSDPDVTSVTLSSTSETLTVGDETTLIVTILPTEGIYNKDVQWTSSDESVVTVDQTGKVSAVGAGSATVTCSSTYTEGKSATCTITVEAQVIAVSSVAFASGVPTTVDEGASIDLSSYVEINPADATSPVITWSVYPSSAGTITDGVFTAGSVTSNTDVTITVKVVAGGKTKTAETDVTIIRGPVAVSSITVSVPAVSQEEKATFQATATVLPTDADVKDVTWSISNSNATIDADGNVTVVGTSGSTFDVIATATDGSGVSGSATITIIDEIIPVTGATIASGTYEVYESGTLDLSSFLSYEPSNATIKSVVWKVTGSYVDIDATTGIVTGKSTSAKREGIKITAVVTSLDGEQVTASTTITLLKDPKYVTEIDIEDALSLEEGETYTFEADVIPSNADDQSITWSIKSGNGGSIDAETGELTITGSEGDEFVVVATANDINKVESNECKVTVLKKTVPVQSITSSISSVSVEAGDINGSTITISYSPANTTQTDFTLNSSSSVFSYVNNGDGTITIVGLQGGTGKLTIRSTQNASVSTEVTVSVTELVKNITVSGSSTLNVGDVAQLSAVAGESTATNKTVSWSSSDPTVATVSETGYVTAKGAGMVQITATANDGSGISNSIYITVSAIPVQSITASNIVMEIGSTATIKATITPSNATYKAVNYTVNDNSVISVDASGVITTYAEGTAVVTITSAADNVSTTITVEVTPVKADKAYLYRLIENEVWGAYAVYYKVEDGTIVIGWGKGQKSPIAYNEFKEAWMNAQDVYDETYATQEEVDAAAQRLYKAIVAMGEKDVEEQVFTAVDDVVTVDAKVYPTIVTNNVTIEAEGLISVKVISAKGSVVAYEQAAGDEIEIDATSFAQGTYKVIVETENGTTVRSFIK